MTVEFDKGLYVANRHRSTDDIAAEVLPLLEPFGNKARLDVVGCWLWLYMDEKPKPGQMQPITQLGFKWNKDRQCWQHPCGVMRAKSPGDPRDKYSTQTFYGSDDDK